eukprot:2003804-Pyramimonas_sp.AAC.1
MERTHTSTQCSQLNCIPPPPPYCQMLKTMRKCAEAMRWEVCIRCNPSKRKRGAASARTLDDANALRILP